MTRDLSRLFWLQVEGEKLRMVKILDVFLVTDARGEDLDLPGLS